MSHIYGNDSWLDFFSEKCHCLLTNKTVTFLFLFPYHFHFLNCHFYEILTLHFSLLIQENASKFLIMSIASLKYNLLSVEEIQIYIIYLMS
jgi:hypothetical protein